uniref:Uncharacterized protein n=1 Tax=Caenorhabditis elegans TaxID=6239 RepID=Q9TYK7_CAEEL|eukprot:NP_494651.2 Uncharacterized protein CELE_Y8A9A.4 [Caenorhabditis elegans]
MVTKFLIFVSENQQLTSKFNLVTRQNADLKIGLRGVLFSIQGLREELSVAKQRIEEMKEDSFFESMPKLEREAPAFMDSPAETSSPDVEMEDVVYEEVVKETEVANF